MLQSVSKINPLSIYFSLAPWVLCAGFKPSNLTQAEFSFLKMNPVCGAPAAHFASKQPQLQMVHVAPQSRGDERRFF